MVVEEQQETFDEIAERAARSLTSLKYDQSRGADARSWEMAASYLAAREALHEAFLRETGQKPSPQTINKAIRKHEWYEGPGASWLSDAMHLRKVFPEVFLSGQKKLPYEDYRRIATSRLSGPDGKAELRQWAEKHQPKRVELLTEIRFRQESEKGVYRPDFALQVSNCWRFSDKTHPAEFDGGIHPELVANLLYYYTDSGDVVLDPMAGGDTTYRVIEKYAFFRNVDERMAFSGPRTVHRCDIEPRWPGIVAADIRKAIPLHDETVDFCLLDPPYFKVPNGRYDTFGATIGEWRQNLRDAIGHVRRVLRPGGCVAIIVDDYLRSREFHPLGYYVFETCSQAGLIPEDTVYNTYPNFITTMDAKQMSQCKRARHLCNQVKVINVFRRP